MTLARDAQTAPKCPTSPLARNLASCGRATRTCPQVATCDCPSGGHLRFA